MEVHKTLEGHTESVYSVACSPNSKLLASASADWTVRLWNIPNGQFNAELKGHTSNVFSVGFSPDGQSIVSGSGDCTVRTWSIATKQPVQILNGHSKDVFSVAWSPNGDVIASGSYDTTVILWDAVSGLAKKTLTGHTHYVYSVSFSQNGNKLVSAGRSDNTAIIWDVNSGAALIKLTHSASVFSVCFSHDDQVVVTGCGDKIVRMFNANTGCEEKRFEGHTDRVESVACSFDGSMIASRSRDKSVRLWDVASTKQLQQLDGHTNHVRSIAFSHDGKFIASGSDDKTVRLWNAPSLLQATLDQTQVAEWSVDDVCGYFKQAKVDDDVIAVFRKQKVKGTVLDQYAKEDKLKSIGIKADGDRTEVIKIIDKLLKGRDDSAKTGLKVHEIPRRELIKYTKLNEGKFGIVWRGTYNGIRVAIKEPKLHGDPDLIPSKQLSDLIEEATVMTSVSFHPNVLHCYGVSRVGEDDYLLVTELCNLGSFDSFLRTYPGTTAVDRRWFSQQAARGLNHLGKYNVTHRDVAARNVLLHDQGFGVIVVKVCDFGLSRREGEYYVLSGEHLLSPETAPEVYETGKHSSRSDVWSFGVLLWEVESLCATRAKPNKAAFPPLSKPAQASDNIYAIMLKCWAKDPHQRPSFEALIDLLAFTPKDEKPWSFDSAVESDAEPSTPKAGSSSLFDYDEVIPSAIENDAVVAKPTSKPVNNAAIVHPLPPKQRSFWEFLGLI